MCSRHNELVMNRSSSVTLLWGHVERCGWHTLLKDMNHITEMLD